MDEQISAYINGFSSEIIELYGALRTLIFESASSAPRETMWARLPSYYVGEASVRLIPFKDHINVEAAAVPAHREALALYKITPKGMLQIYQGQALPAEILKQIFAETLG